MLVKNFLLIIILALVATKSCRGFYKEKRLLNEDVGFRHNENKIVEGVAYILALTCCICNLGM